MSSFIPFVSSLPVLPLLMSYTMTLNTMKLSTILMVGLLWLTFGVLVTSVISSQYVSLMWWSLLLVLVLSFSFNNIIMFYIVFELSLVPILAMILFHGSQPERLSAGLYFLMYTSTLSFPYLLVVVLLLPSYFHFKMTSVVFASTLFNLIMILPFLVKMPVMGLHFWLPMAHVEASTSGSMVLAGLLLKLGSYGLFVMLATISLAFYHSMWLIFSVIASYITFLQSDTKKFIAFSSVTHMTFMMVGLVSSVKASLMIVLILSLAHGWASSGMFLSAGSSSHSKHTRLGVFNKHVSFYWVTMILGLLLVVNASVPPTASFYPEVLMILSISGSELFSASLFVVLSVFVCYYNTFLLLWFSQSKPASLVAAVKSSNPEAMVNTMNGFCSFVSVILLSLM